MNWIRKLFFNLWYFRQPPWDTNISPPELLAFIAENKPGRALDLGCGSGTNVIRLAQAGWQACGVDFAGRAIQMARRKARRKGAKATFYVEDVTRLSKVQGQFDLILDMGCFHNLSAPGKQAYLQNLARHLAPGGTYLLYAFYNAESQPERAGISPAELALLEAFLQQVARADSLERKTRPAVWLTYRRPLS